MKSFNSLRTNKPSVFLFTVMVIWLMVVGIQSPANAFSVEDEVAIDKTLKLLNRPWEKSRSWKVNLVRINNKNYVDDKARPMASVPGGRSPGSMPGGSVSGGRSPGSQPGGDVTGGRLPGSMP